MSKNKHKDNFEHNPVVPGINHSRPVTDEDMEDIIVPFVRQRFSRGFRSVYIYLSCLIILLCFLLYKSGEESLHDVVKYGGMVLAGLLGFFLLLYLINVFRASRLKKEKLNIMETEFVKFSKDRRTTMSYKYKTLVVPAMVVNEKSSNGRMFSKTYDCLLQDTDHFSAGNSINRRLMPGDKVYRITDKKGQVIYLIGEGKKHVGSAKGKKSPNIFTSILRAFVGCFIMGLGIIALQGLATLGRYIIDCIRFKELLAFKYVTWYCLFGEVSNIWEFLFFGFFLPILFFVLVLILMPILGTHIVDMFFGFRKDKED